MLGANRIITKSWLIGFTEAEGSFYIESKKKGERGKYNYIR